MRPSVTALAALVLLAAFALAVATREVDSTGDAEPSLARVVGRDLDLEAGLERAASWERRLYAWSMLETPDTLQQAIDWYDELSAGSLDPAIDLRLAILRAEAGQRDDVARTVEQWSAGAQPFPLLAEVLAAAYLGGAVSRGEAREMRRGVAAALGGPDWFLDRLTIALAGRAGDAWLRTTAEASLGRRAGRMLARTRALAATDIAIGLAGAVGLAGALRRLRRTAGGLRVADAPLPPPWPPGMALAVLIRGGAAGALVMAAFLATDAPDDVVRVTLSLAANGAALPLLLLARRFLLRPAGLGLADGLGLRPGRGAWEPLAVATLALVGLGTLGDWVTSLGGGLVGWPSHWTEWFDPDLVWGRPAVVLLTSVDACLFAPAVEEVVFRGLVFGALRTRLPLSVAALGSGAIFAAAHGYGAVGFASVLWSGLIWAWAYERTGSLLPGMAAHAFNNVSASLAVLVLYR